MDSNNSHKSTPIWKTIGLGIKTVAMFLWTYVVMKLVSATWWLIKKAYRIITYELMTIAVVIIMVLHFGFTLNVFAQLWSGVITLIVMLILLVLEFRRSGDALINKFALDTNQAVFRLQLVIAGIVVGVMQETDPILLQWSLIETTTLYSFFTGESTDSFFDQVAMLQVMPDLVTMKNSIIVDHVYGTVFLLACYGMTYIDATVCVINSFKSAMRNITSKKPEDDDSQIA